MAGFAMFLALALLLGWAGETMAAENALEPHYRALRPSGPGPFPAIMLVSGCSGVTPRGSTARVGQAERLQKEGYYVVFVDYLAARGLQSACRGELKVDQIARDILMVATHLKSRPDVKASEMGLIGWSLGGGSVLATLSLMKEDQPPPVRAVVAFYPFCRDVARWKVAAPALILLAGADDWTPPSQCQDVAKQVSPPDSVTVRVFAEARHNFDVPGPPVVPFGRVTLGYHPTAAKEAWDEVYRFLKQHLTQGR